MLASTEYLAWEGRTATECSNIDILGFTTVFTGFIGLPKNTYHLYDQGGTSFVDLLCFCSVLCLLCLCAGLFILFICALWSPAGKGLTSWLSFVVSTVSLSLSHWYPGSGMVLDCIDS